MGEGFFCKKVDLSSAQGALCTVSVLLLYILLIWEGPTHPTHPLPTGLKQYGLIPVGNVVLGRQSAWLSSDPVWLSRLTVLIASVA